MPSRPTFPTPNQRYIDEAIHGPRRPPPGSDSDSDSNPAHRNTRHDTTDTSSSEGLGESTTTRSREPPSDSDSDPDPRSRVYRRVTRRGGLGAVAGEMFSSREARVAERAERRAEEDREDWMRGRGRGGEQQPLPGNRRGQITRHPDRIGSYSVQTDNYAYHAQMDGNGRLRRLSEVGDDGRGHRLSLRRLGGGSGGDGGAAFLDTDDDEPTAPRGYSGGGLGARREEYDDDFEGPSTPRANSGRRMSFGRG